MSSEIVVGIDLGGTKVLAGTVTTNGHVLGRSLLPTQPERPAADVLETIADAARRAVAAADIKLRQVAGVGLGSPGPLELSTGKLISPMNLPSLHGVNILDELSSRLDRPVVFNNDANCLGLGEARFGAGRGVGVCCGLTLGTGLGGFAVIDGEPYDGPHGAGVEIWCSPYLRDQVENSTNGAALARNYFKLTGARVSAAEVGEMADAGDEQALEAWREYARDLSVPVAWLCNVFDPDVFVLGGSVASGWKHFHGELLHEAGKYINAVTRRSVRFEPAQLAGDAGMLGAAALALNRFA